MQLMTISEAARTSGIKAVRSSELMNDGWLDAHVHVQHAQRATFA